MHFSSAINRPQSEADSAFLQVTSGCSHNTCRFCIAFKDAAFAPSPYQEIRDDVLEIARMSAKPPKRVFYQGANALALGYDRLMAIAGLIHEMLPSVQSIGCYGRMDDLTDFSVNQLRKMHEAGYENLCFGLESGDDEVLAFMDKGYDSALALEQGLKLGEAGMPFRATYVTGLAGAGKGMRNARLSAELFNQIRPQTIGSDSLVVLPRTPLYDDVRQGRFKEAGEVERIEEVIEFISLIDYDCYFNADHITYPMQLRGQLPDDRDVLIETYRLLLMTVSEARMRAYREKIWPAMMPEYTQQGPLFASL